MSVPRRLADIPVLVIVWAQPGCGHCEAYEPHVRRVAKRHPGVPVHVVDVNQVWNASEHYRVASTPTTSVLRHGRRTAHHEGDLGEAGFEALLSAVERGRER